MSDAYTQLRGHGLGGDRVIALVSGGIDSTVALWMAMEQRFQVIKTVHFQYGQSHAREIASAQAVCDHANLPTPQIVRLNFDYLRGLTALLPKDGFSHDDAAKTTTDQFGEEVSATYVPGRNIVMLALAGGMADALRAHGIVGGWNAEDYSGYPDCRPLFLSSMQTALGLGLRWPCFIYSPLNHRSKADIIKLGQLLGAPLELTWSCYAGNDSPCGKCPSCKVRIAGFAKADLLDPALPLT
jgi:7-cyano-7-deazaguanine synthase